MVENLINLYFNCHRILFIKHALCKRNIMFLRRLGLFYNDIVNCFMDNYVLT